MKRNNEKRVKYTLKKACLGRFIEFIEFSEWGFENFYLHSFI